MADYNKHLTPVWIVYVDGKRLDTDHEGALKKKYKDTRLDTSPPAYHEIDYYQIFKETLWQQSKNFCIYVYQKAYENKIRDIRFDTEKLSPEGKNNT